MARFGRSFPEFKNLDEINNLARSQNNFTRDLYLALAKETDGNLFFSPFSIMTALTMAHMGTSGNTADELNKIMHLNQEKDTVKAAFQELIADFRTPQNEYQLDTSNMMYVSENLEVLESFKTSLTEYFHSTAKLADFVGKTEEVRNEINTEVEKATKSKIKDLLAPGILTADTMMVLVNAVYFKGLWKNTFKENQTYDQDFFVTPTNPIKVPMMHIEDDFRHGRLDHLNASLLAMDYQGDRLSMIIVLPDAKDGLQELESKLTDEDIYRWDKIASTKKVEVSLPKFNLEQTISLPTLLQKMGIKDLFNANACDLSGITGNKDLFVSEVIHKSFIEVNEKGSEAAAATAAIMMMRCARIPQKAIFTADHPFLFMIKDNATNFFVFSGKYVKTE